MVTGLPSYFYLQKLDNLTRIPSNFSLSKLAQYSRSYDDSKTVEQHYIFIISQLWLISHPRSTVVLLDTGTPGTSREIYSEDASDGA